MELKEYLNRGVSPFHVVKEATEALKEAGFTEVKLGGGEPLEPGKGYYMCPYPSSFFAFRTDPGKAGMQIAMAHTDWPSFLLKPNPEMPEGVYLRVNTEPYGGMLKHTWFDRPLGLAGRVLLKNDGDVFSPKEVLFDSEEPWFVIPSLAPHLDREIETEKIDPQKVMLPLYGIKQADPRCSAPAAVMEEKVPTLLEKVAEKLHVAVSDILSYTLYLYNADPAQEVGIDGELLLSPRIDNVASVAALTEAILQAKGSRAGISLIACFDNEEIGSRTKQGADSGLLKDVAEDIYRRLGKADRMTEEYAQSMMLSVDGAHGVHPNYREKSDTTATVALGGGVVLKSSASQRYVTDARAAAVVKGLCESCGIRLQEQANRSGAPGGQTLGPIASSYLPILAADLGIPMLAMHSARELAALSDCTELERLIRAFL
ncbi:MAG: M18 family aminopeptidase [Lachnospiraceae bacterium]|nr:M18 family aminopeptidase [Lachnospiraceae bacterium]